MQQMMKTLFPLTCLLTGFLAGNNQPHVVSALSVKRQFVELSPLKASMLTKGWQSLLTEVDQKVAVVPELGSTSAGVRRFGPELERRTLCAAQFNFFREATFGLALADKADDPAKLRRELPSLRSIAGASRGARCAVFACLTSPATMCLVEKNSAGALAGAGDEEEEAWWSVLALCVNPEERSIPTIVASEKAALDEVRSLASAAEGDELQPARVRIHAPARATLAGSEEELELTPLPPGVGAAEGEEGAKEEEGGRREASTWLEMKAAAAAS